MDINGGDSNEGEASFCVGAGLPGDGDSYRGISRDRLRGVSAEWCCVVRGRLSRQPGTGIGVHVGRCVENAQIVCVVSGDLP